MKRIIPLLALAVLTLAVTLAFAAPQRMRKPGRMPAPDRIAAALEKAGVPLSADQLDKIKALEPGEKGPGVLRDILTDEQKQVLRKHFAQGPGPQRIMRGMAQQLKKAGCPLTTDQIEKLKALKPGERNREVVQSILTDQQKEALQAAFRENAEKRLNDLAARLEKAGAPLTQEQLDTIKALEPGEKGPGALQNILTDEQKEVLRKGMRGGPGAGLFDRLSARLEKAG
ncbi:MAG: hypothetical protein ACYC9O_14505, partial [Candidatus Latescibacterota bacterium]